MADILGLSHLIFSSQRRLLNVDSPLCNLFLPPEFYRFDHFSAKKDLLREKRDAMTSLTLYNSVDGSLPSLEIIPSVCENRRPLTEYGIIFPSSAQYMFNGLPKMRLNARFAEECLFEHVHISDDLPSLLAISPELDRLSCPMGAWITVPSLPSAVDFLANFAGASQIALKDGYALLKVKVMNKKFSNFLMIVVESRTPEAGYYNDDIGLAAFGWFAKRLPQIPENLKNAYFTSPEFEIRIKNNRFTAEFFYDNKAASHEIMVICQRDFKETSNQ